MAEKKKKEGKKRKKGLWIVLGILASIIIIGIVAFVILSKESIAALYIESGTVQINKGSGWMPAVEGMELKQDWSVKTLDGEATIVFYNSEIMRMDKNTEIVLAEISQAKIGITQSAGSIWNRVLKLTGVEEYRVETPTTVATVRGTGFNVKVLADGADIIVGEGNVEVASDYESGLFGAMKKASVRNKIIEKLELDDDDKTLLKLHEGKDIEMMKKVRKKIFGKYKPVVNAVKKKYGWTDEKLEGYLERVDKGEYNVDGLVAKAPAKPKDLYVVAGLTKRIQQYTKGVSNSTCVQSCKICQGTKQ